MKWGKCLLLHLPSEVPRKFNHRYLVPLGIDETLVQYVTAHLKDHAVLEGRQIRQASSGRMSQEWVALVGLNPAKLSATERQKIQDGLKSLLHDNLDGLMKGENWNLRAAKHYTIQVPQLAEWFEKYPAFQVTTKPIPRLRPKKPISYPINFTVGTLGAIVLVGACVAMNPQAVNSQAGRQNLAEWNYSPFCEDAVGTSHCNGPRVRQAVYEFHAAVREALPALQEAERQTAEPLQRRRSELERFISEVGEMAIRPISVPSPLSQDDSELRRLQNQLRDLELQKSDAERETLLVQSPSQIQISDSPQSDLQRLEAEKESLEEKLSDWE